MTNNKPLILIFIAVVFVLGGLLYIYNPEPQEYKNPDENDGVVCSMDAKLCPDGSYVGRSGPNCEFKECPETSTPSTSSGQAPIFEDGTILE